MSWIADWNRKRKIKDYAARKNVDGLIRIVRKSHRPDIQKEAAEALSSLGEIAVLPIFRAIKELEEEYKRKKHKFDRIGHFSERFHYTDTWDLLYNSFKSMDRKTQDYILTLLDSKDTNVRVKSLRALHDMEFKAPVGPIINALRDESSNVRATASYLMADINNETLKGPLLLALRDEDEVVRGNAAYALRFYKDTHIVDQLIKLTKDPHADSRWGAVSALGEIGDRSALRHITRLFDDEDFTVRHCVAEALGNIGDPSSFQTLQKMADDEEHWVKESAYKAMGKIDKIRAREVFKKKVRSEVDYEPYKREKKVMFKEMAKVGLFGAVFGVPIFYLYGFNIGEALGYSAYFNNLFITLTLDGILLFFFFFVLFVLMDYYPRFISRRNANVEFYGFEMYNENYYEFLKKRISKYYKITEDANPSMKISIPNINEEPLVMTITPALFEQKGDSTIYIEKFKDLDESNKQRIVSCINEAMIDYALAPDE